MPAEHSALGRSATAAEVAQSDSVIVAAAEVVE